MGTISRRCYGSGLLAAVLAAALAGCGSMKTEAETVFLRQNQVSGALMQAIMAAEIEDPSLADQLYMSEEELQLACGPLQKAGFQTLHDDHVEQSVQFAAFNAMRACAIKSSEVGQFLWQVDPATARGYLGPVEVEAAPRSPLKVLAGRSSMR